MPPRLLTTHLGGCRGEEIRHIKTQGKDQSITNLLDEYTNFRSEGKALISLKEPTAAGSFALVIDPSHFGALEEFKAKSDRFMRSAKLVGSRSAVEEIFLLG